MSLKVFLLLGEKQRMWLNKLKSAVVMRDVFTIEKLLEDVPTLTQQEIQESVYLLKEAAKIAQELRDETQVQMQKIKKNIDFLEATQTKKIQHLVLLFNFLLDSKL